MDYLLTGFVLRISAGKKGRKTRLEILASETRTIIIYESPYRLVLTLEQLAGVMGPGRMALCFQGIEQGPRREQTRDPVLKLHGWYNKNEPKGEIVIVVKGRGKDNEMEE